MDMDQAAVFLAGSILTAMGFLVILIAVIIGNNLLSKYWKPIKWMRVLEHPMYTIQDENPVQKPETK